MPTTRTNVVALTSPEVVRPLADVTGPVLSVVAPVNRAGVQRPEGPNRLRSMLDEIARDLERYQSDGHSLDRASQLLLLDVVVNLADDELAWAYPSGSVISVVTSAESHTLWTPMQFGEGFHVGPMAPLRCLLSAVVEAPDFNLVELSLGSVRLRVPNENRLIEVAAPAMPSSIDDALRFDDHERRLTNHTAGTESGHDMRFHGHGVGDEVDRERVERFIRAVDRGLTAALRESGRDDAPLVVAGVGEHLPVLRSISALPDIVAIPFTINPNDNDRQVIDAIRELLPRRGTRAVETTIERFAEHRGTGMTTEGAEASLEAAREGRVATAIIERCHALDDSSGPSVLLDSLIAEVWHTGGDVVVAEPALFGMNVPCACILRH